MSASNWALCPRCKKDRLAQIDASHEAITLAYGTVPIEVWDDMRSSLDGLRSARIEHTFREDYEIYGAETGTIIVDYSGSCKTCGLAQHFKYEVPLDV